MEAPRINPASARTMRCAACGREGLSQDAQSCDACGKVLKRDAAHRRPSQVTTGVRAPRTVVARSAGRATGAGASAAGPLAPAARTYALNRRAFTTSDEDAPPAPAATRRAHPAQIRAAMREVMDRPDAPPPSAPVRRVAPPRAEVVVPSGRAVPVWRDRVIGAPTSAHARAAPPTPGASFAAAAAALSRAEVNAAAPIDEALLEELAPTSFQVRWHVTVIWLAVALAVLILLAHALGT